MKCSICKAAMAETFLGKPKGTYIKDSKGKLRLVCFECQKKLRTKESMLDKL